jgi:hypothetical protein
LKKLKLKIYGPVIKIIIKSNNNFNSILIINTKISRNLSLHRMPMNLPIEMISEIISFSDATVQINTLYAFKFSVNYLKYIFKYNKNIRIKTVASIKTKTVIFIFVVTNLKQNKIRIKDFLYYCIFGYKNTVFKYLDEINMDVVDIICSSYGNNIIDKLRVLDENITKDRQILNILTNRFVQHFKFIKYYVNENVNNYTALKFILNIIGKNYITNTKKLNYIGLLSEALTSHDYVSSDPLFKCIINLYSKAKTLNIKSQKYNKYIKYLGMDAKLNSILIMNYMKKILTVKSEEYVFSNDFIKDFIYNNYSVIFFEESIQFYNNFSEYFDNFIDICIPIIKNDNELDKLLTYICYMTDPITIFEKDAYVFYDMRELQNNLSIFIKIIYDKIISNGKDKWVLNDKLLPKNVAIILHNINDSWKLFKYEISKLNCDNEIQLNKLFDIFISLDVKTVNVHKNIFNNMKNITHDILKKISLVNLQNGKNILYKLGNLTKFNLDCDCILSFINKNKEYFYHANNIIMIFDAFPYIKHNKCNEYTEIYHFIYNNYYDGNFNKLIDDAKKYYDKDTNNLTTINEINNPYKFLINAFPPDTIKYIKNINVTKENYQFVVSVCGLIKYLIEIFYKFQSILEQQDKQLIVQKLLSFNNESDPSDENNFYVEFDNVMFFLKKQKNQFMSLNECIIGIYGYWTEYELMHEYIYDYNPSDNNIVNYGTYSRCSRYSPSEFTSNDIIDIEPIDYNSMYNNYNHFAPDVLNN